MPDEPTPPRKNFAFKEPTFDSINPQRPPATKTRSTRTPKLIPEEPKPIQVRDLYRQATQPPIPVAPGTRPAAPAAPAPDPNRIEVKKLMLKNLAAEKEKGLDQMAFPAGRGSRRTRDYLVCLAIGNLIGLVAIVIVPVLGIAALVLYNVALAWILFGVLDDY